MVVFAAVRNELRATSLNWAELPVKLSVGRPLPTVKPAPLAAQSVLKVIGETVSVSLLASLSLASSASAGKVMVLERMLVMMWSAPATGAALE
ncbi:hypothetical protein D3C77_519760 [compost metagenome]